MTLSITRLAGSRALVQGSDFAGTIGKQVISSAEWDAFKASTKFDDLTASFNEKVASFFAPITEAIDELAELTEQETLGDPAFYVRLQEAVEPTEGQPEILQQLSYDSVVLRLIEEGATDRLIWVNDKLEILAAPFDADVVEVEDHGTVGDSVGSEVPEDLTGTGSGITE